MVLKVKDKKFQESESTDKLSSGNQQQTTVTSFKTFQACNLLSIQYNITKALN